MIEFLTGAYDYVAGGLKSGLDWISEKFGLTLKEESDVQEKLAPVVENSKVERHGIMESVLGRGWALALDTLKVLAQKNGTLSDIAVISEQLLEKPENKSMFDSMKLGYMILEKIPFLGSFIESTIARLPYFMDIAEMVDKDLAERIKAGDNEAVSLMVQKILAILDLIRDQIAYKSSADKEAEKVEHKIEAVKESASASREGLMGSMLGRAWQGCQDVMKIWAQSNETTGDLSILIEQFTEGKDKKTIADSLKMFYMVLEKIPLLGSAVETMLPKLPYFKEIAHKIDENLAEKMESGDGEATSQIVQKMIGYLELTLNQLNYGK